MSYVLTSRDLICAGYALQNWVDFLSILSGKPIVHLYWCIVRTCAYASTSLYTKNILARWKDDSIIRILATQDASFFHCHFHSYILNLSTQHVSVVLLLVTQFALIIRYKIALISYQYYHTWHTIVHMCIDVLCIPVLMWVPHHYQLEYFSTVEEWFS